ncbi:DUF2158 domain-containing protein [Roseomonas haemaphysalidis]|uniref:DUF2158 domain-containing protein n=1 Tax=Roseomonas haemaphysalidis TaxID=2768162 RepID=A0ABS3KWI3_9PROT|nr:DUF2158 domain-containing protein [Roseomonas haemaphysalidis]MBO1081836.1 DUF2158 domain-containing protein [Roseomonas haemaphysalidis]
MSNVFKRGDVVVLKSGGPPMTVEAAPAGLFRKFMGDDAVYQCAWFHENKRFSNNFNGHALELYRSTKQASDDT